MGTTAPPAPTRTKTTIFKETLPPSERSASDAQPSEFYRGEWESILAKLTPELWETHLLRVYRADEKWDRESSPIDNKFKFSPTEEDLRKRFGGGRFLLWLYGPPKEQNLVARWRVPLEGDPIVNTIPRNGASTNGAESVAIEAMKLYANPEFVRMQMEMMRTAATQAMELIKSQIPQAQDPLATLRNAKEILGIGTPAPNPMDEIYKTLMTALVQKLLNPPETNSLQDTIKLVNDIKTSGLLGGAPKADLASTFASNLPMLVDRMVSGLHEFRLRAEAEERVIRLQRGEIRPGDPNVITVDPNQNSTAPPNAGAAHVTASAPASPAPATSVTPEVAQAIIAQAHLHRLVAGIKQPNATGQDMYDYLVNAWPEILDELGKMNKETLLAFFKSRETQKQYFGADILAEVADDPRLPKMIEDFLKIAKEGAEAEKAVSTQVAV